MAIISRFLTTMFLERPGRKHDYASWAQQLEQAGADRQTQFSNSADSQKNHKVLSHLIGIERWAQGRLRVAFGDPFVDEEYIGHRPGRETTWAELQQQFISTRAESVTLAEELASKQIPTTVAVKHNQFGDVTTRGWLRYILMHANQESKAIK